MARKSNHFKATKQAKLYLKHAERLQTLLRDYDDGSPEEDYYSAEFATLYEDMEVESANQVFAPTVKQPAVTRTPKNPEKSVQFSESTLSKDILNNKVQALRNEKARSRKNIHSPFSSTETFDEQSQLNTKMVIHAQVHNPDTNRNSHTPLSTTTHPDSRTDVTDNPHPSSTIMLGDKIMHGSTDT
jgi:hypothetical protein